MTSREELIAELLDQLDLDADDQPVQFTISADATPVGGCRA